MPTNLSEMALLLPRVSKQQKWPSPAITAATQQHNKATPPHPMLPTLASNTSAKPWRHIQLPPATCLMPVSLILLTQERLLCFSITFHSDHHDAPQSHKGLHFPSNHHQKMSASLLSLSTPYVQPTNHILEHSEGEGRESSFLVEYVST